MSELGLGFPIVVLLYFIPGYLFLLVLSRFAFKSSRPSRHLPLLLVSSVVATIASIALFDRPAVKHCFEVLLNFFRNHSFVSCDYIQRFTREPFLDSSLKFFGLAGKQTDWKEVGFLVKTILFAILPFSGLAGFTLAAALRFGTRCSRQDFGEYVYRGALGLERLIHLLGFGRAFKRLSKHLNFSITLPKNIIGTAVSAIAATVAGLVALFVLVVVLLIVAVVVIVNLVFETLFLLFERTLSLFRHPWESVFENPSFLSRTGITIAEIRTADSLLYKGKFLSFEPLNADEISAITISNVIQYAIKNETQKFFTPSNRRVHIFRNSLGQLTIPYSKVENLHVWHLNSYKYRRDGYVSSEDEVTNQIWYLRFLLTERPAGFDLMKLKPTIKYTLAPKFFHELLKLLDEMYKGRLYKIKLRRLLLKLAGLMQIYYRLIRKNKAQIKPEQMKGISSEVRQSLGYLRLLNQRTR